MRRARHCNQLPGELRVGRHREPQVLLEDGAVECWGSSAHGLRGTSPEPDGAATRLEFGGAVEQVSMGFWHGCVVMESGDVKCWGSNTGAQLGDGTTETRGDDASEWEQVPRVPLSGSASQVVTGINRSCARMQDGRLFCWGALPNANDAGTAGHLIGDVPGEVENQPAEATGGKMLSLSLQSFQSCGVRADGQYVCGPTSLSEYSKILPGHPHDPHADGQLGYSREWRVTDLALQTHCVVE